MPLDYAIRYSKRHLFPILLRAGAALPAETTNAYIQKVRAAGGIKKYEHNHLNALAAILSSPTEVSRRRWSAASSSTRSTWGTTKYVRPNNLVPLRERVRAPRAAVEHDHR